MEKRFTYRWVWLTVAAATVAFIWQQSTLAPADSAATSNAVGGVLLTLFGGTETPLGAFLSRYLRKIAHFVEFFALGLETEAYLAGRHTPTRIVLQLLFGLAVAATDEFLQIFSGRGSAFTDVLLDFCGYLAGAAFLFLAIRLIKFLNKKRKVGAEKCGTAGSDV